MKYSKLVRDNIPDIILKKGGMPVIHYAHKEEYRLKLNEKLQEEVREFLQTEDCEEIADILEVIDAICDLHKIKKDDLLKIKNKKLKERGGFKKKIILDES